MFPAAALGIIHEPACGLHVILTHASTLAEECLDYGRNMPAIAIHTAPGAEIAPVAALMGDPARAAMLTALLDERALAAGELAGLAGVSPATGSSHLARLLDGGLVTVVSQGRHRYYRLAGHEVATAIEALSQLGAPAPVRSLRQSRQAAALADARTCYDHLAGQAGVALLDALLAGGILVGTADQPSSGAAPQARATPAGFDVSAVGESALQAFGVDVCSLRRARRRFAGACLDWTQRRPHLNGALGAAITTRLLDLGWIERGAHRRAVRVTPAGRDGLADTFGCSLGPAAGLR
jgi:DNA-binding transcriptional ArsR family regulator